ncbi:hypothetical protein IAI53_05960 [Thauera sp. CAU 1555]|uniref:Transmembrane protein n=1 Tax=Thauera sedimentorum TaxID=2767595 RepID=A0ABR9B851_9RHOO|nr:hypothetical protein [Thauera sedimentorum]MBC9071503.1 hypothetical protein [Thauera sedimentorum]MBD8502422.1 hypothetical protein [Thauera sedimentorum]
MPLFPKPRATELPGDFSRRVATYALLAFLIGLAASAWLFIRLPEIWAQVMPLEGASFMLAATALGAVMAVMPVVAAAGFVVALWSGVDSVYRPRRQPSPLLDRVIVGLGLLIWFAPALGGVGAAINAIATGRVHFVRPPRDYFLATDPTAFWQGVGFWLIMSALFAFLAWRYWRGKLLAKDSAA